MADVVDVFHFPLKSTFHLPLCPHQEADLQWAVSQDPPARAWAGFG